MHVYEEDFQKGYKQKTVSIYWQQKKEMSKLAKKE